MTHENPSHRDRTVNRLKAIAEIALRGWIESLPARVDDPYDAENVRRQKLTIHALGAEADTIVDEF